MSFASAGVSCSSALVAASTEEPGTIAIEAISSVITNAVWSRMLFLRFLGSGVIGVHLHHEEKLLSSQSTRITPGMS